MVYIINELRALCEAGTADYMIAGSAYWTDEQLQNILDDYRIDFKFAELACNEDYQNGDTVYTDYYLPAGWLEADSSINYIRDGSGGSVSESYTADYRTGKFIFNSDQNGKSYYMSGRAYNLQKSAADIWRKKAAHYAMLYNFSTDGHNLQREVLMKHCLDMAAQLEASLGMESIGIVRSDTE